MNNLTPQHLRCHVGCCPSVHELEDGRLRIVGEEDANVAGCGEGERAIIIDPALLDDVPRGWRTIDSAPRDKNILLWWRPRSPNPHAEACVIGQLSSYEEGKWWNSQRGEYQDVSHVTHWRPLPLPPNREGA